MHMDHWEVKSEIIERLDGHRANVNNAPSVLQVLPPLIIQEDEAQQVLAILDGMLRGLEAAFC